MAGYVVIAIHIVHSYGWANTQANLSLIWVGLQCVIVVLPDHTNILFSYSSILLIKIQQKCEIGLSVRVGVIIQFLEHRL